MFTFPIVEVCFVNISRVSPLVACSLELMRTNVCRGVVVGY